MKAKVDADHVRYKSSGATVPGPDHTSGADDGADLWWSGILGRTRRKPILACIQVSGSVAAIGVSVLLAHVMRFGLPASEGIGGLVTLPAFAGFQPYLPFGLMAMIVFPLIFHSLGLYSYPGSNILPFGQWITIGKGVVLGTVIMAAASSVFVGTFAEGEGVLSFVFLAYFAALAYFGALLVHSAILIGVLALQTCDVGLRRVALVHGGDLPLSLVEALSAPSSAYRLAGGIECGGASESLEHAPIASLGTLDTLGDLINEHDLDELVLAVDPSLLTAGQRMEIAQTCWRLGVELKMVAPFYPFFHTSAKPEQVGDVSLLRIEKLGLNARWSQVLKRGMDLAVSSLVLTVTSPLLLAAVMAIRLDSKGPAFFVQTRVGLNGRTFRMIKLRSMRSDADDKLHQEYLKKLIREKEAGLADADGTVVYKMVNDPRITRVGKFLRKTSLDELPQLVNVLRGEMSLVGPRPPLPYEVAEYEGWHFRRLNIRPGMTGLWQVSGRSTLTYEQMIRLDIEYIENWSLWLDIKILLKTIPAVLKMAHSY